MKTIKTNRITRINIYEKDTSKGIYSEPAPGTKITIDDSSFIRKFGNRKYYKTRITICPPTVNNISSPFYFKNKHYLPAKIEIATENAILTRRTIRVFDLKYNKDYTLEIGAWLSKQTLDKIRKIAHNRSDKIAEYLNSIL